MKKLVLFAFAVLFAMASMAQNRATILAESFNNSGMPAGWSIAGLGTTNWSISSTNNAGGAPNELHLYYGPQFNGTSRFVSPAVNLTGISSVVVSFKHALDNYQGSHTLGIATSSDDGKTWNVGWSQNYGSDGVWEVLQNISTTDMGQDNVRFCLYYSGNSYNIDNWYFDDIEIFTLENLDLFLTEITVPSIVSGETTLAVDQNVGMKVRNYGVTPITSLQATYEIEGMEPVTELFNVNIASLGVSTINFQTPTHLNPGGYDVTVTINKVNGTDDNNLDNNQLSKHFSVAMAAAERTPMIEHFSSSTCGPCVSINNQMNTFCNNNAGRFTYTKYQMNWPGNGDPYYTTEGGVRRNYYGIGAVPNVILDATNIGAAAVSASLFNQHAAMPAFFDVRGSFTVDGNNIHVLVDVMPYVDIMSRIYVAVNEKVTTGNVGGNGETSFHHVFMKMLPNAEGSIKQFHAGELQHLEFTQNMSSTHVEEMSDLEVAIWVQNYSTQEIYNSRFAFEYTDHPYPVENLVMTKENETTYKVTWNAPAIGTPVGYDVYFNNEKVLEGTTNMEYTFTTDPDAFNVVGVVALYANDKKSVKAIVSQAEELQDQGLVITDTPEVALTVDMASQDVMVTNANYVSQAPVEILSVTETAVNPDTNEPYLVIELDHELPYALPFEEQFVIHLSPNYHPTKGVANTVVAVESADKTVEFHVTIDGELLSITEVTETAKMFPNPTTGNFTVQGANIDKVEIYNLVGQKVYEQQGSKVVNIDASSWNKGLYLVAVTSTQGVVETKKLMVQ